MEKDKDKGKKSEDKENYDEKIQDKKKDEDETEDEAFNIDNFIKDVDNELDNLTEIMNSQRNVIPSLSMLKIVSSNSSAFKFQDNTISLIGNENKWETCVLNEPLSYGIYRVTFTMNCNDPVIFGLIDERSGCPPSGVQLGSNYGVGLVTAETLYSKIANSTKEAAKKFSIIPDNIVNISFEYLKKIIGGVGDILCNITSTFSTVCKCVKITAIVISGSFSLLKIDSNSHITNYEGKESENIERINNGDEIIMEIDLRSKDPNERRLYYYINNEQCSFYIKNIPPTVMVAV